MKYQVVYAYESLANFPNRILPEEFDSVESAASWIKNNREINMVYIIEEVMCGQS